MHTTYACTLTGHGETYVLCNYVLNSIINELIDMNDDIIKQGDARAACNEEDPAIINQLSNDWDTCIPTHI